MNINLKSIRVSIKLPYIGGIEGTWEPNQAEIIAAWELYIELATRITTVPLGPEEGLLREALSSMHDIFKITREILRKHGPDVAKPQKDGQLSLAYIAISILNYEIRPILAKWHPLLLNFENKRLPQLSQLEHELSWQLAGQLRSEIENARKTMMSYADLLAKAAGVPTLTFEGGQ